MCLLICRRRSEVRQLLYCTAGGASAPRPTPNLHCDCALSLGGRSGSVMVHSSCQATLRSTFTPQPPPAPPPLPPPSLTHTLRPDSPCYCIYVCLCSCARWLLEFTVRSLAIKRQRVRRLHSGTISDQAGQWEERLARVGQRSLSCLY